MLKRKTINGKELLIGFHTQEYRPMSPALEMPILCKARNAWLGIAYYFWTDKQFAHYWGIDFKCGGTEKAYDIYKAYLVVDKCINAVFDEEGYFFFRDKIVETIEHFQSQGMEVTLEQVNRFLADNIWPILGVEGVIYDDKPINSNKSDRIHSEIPELYYNKRIQVALFDLKNILNFELVDEGLQ